MQVKFLINIMKNILLCLFLFSGHFLRAQNTNKTLPLADKKIEGEVWFTTQELKTCSVDNVKIKKEDAQVLEITFTAKAPMAGKYGNGYNIWVNFLDKDKKILPVGYCWLNNRRPVNNEFAQQYTCTFNGKANACKSPYQLLENIAVQYIEIKIEAPFGTNKSISYYFAYTPNPKTSSTQITETVTGSNNNTNNIIPIFKPEPIDDAAKNYISANPVSVTPTTATRDIHAEVTSTLPAQSILNLAMNLRFADLYRNININSKKPAGEFKEYVQVDKSPKGPSDNPINFLPLLRISNYYTGDINKVTEDLNCFNNFEIYQDKNINSNTYYYRPKALFLKHNPFKKEKQFDMRISYGTEEKDPFVEFTLTSGLSPEDKILLSNWLVQSGKSYNKFIPYYNKETTFDADFVKNDAFETKDVRIEPVKGSDDDRNMVMTMTRSGIDMLVENLKDYNSEYKVMGTLKSSGDNTTKPLLFLIDPTIRKTIGTWSVPQLKGTITSSRNPSPFNSKPKFLHVLNYENMGNQVYVPFIYTFKLKSLNGIESVNGYQDIKLDLTNFPNTRPLDFIKAWIEYEADVSPEAAEAKIDQIFGESNISIRPYNKDSLLIKAKPDVFEVLGVTKLDVYFKSKLFDERNTKYLNAKVSFTAADTEGFKTASALFFRSDQDFDYSKITMEIKAYKDDNSYSSGSIKLEDNMLTITSTKLTGWIPALK